MDLRTYFLGIKFCWVHQRELSGIKTLRREFRTARFFLPSGACWWPLIFMLKDFASRMLEYSFKLTLKLSLSRAMSLASRFLSSFVAMLSNGFLITWMNFNWVFRVACISSKSFKFRGFVSFWLVAVPFLSPMTCVRYQSSKMYCPVDQTMTETVTTTTTTTTTLTTTIATFIYIQLHITKKSIPR